MLSKEEILTYVQQGGALPGWQVLRPQMSYLVKQMLIYAILALIFIGFGVYFIGQNSFVIVPFRSSDPLDPGAFQVWRYIDEAILALAIIGFAGLAIKYILEVSTVQSQVLVLMPEGFLLKKRNAEQFVAYAGVSSMVPRINNTGEVTLNIKPAGSTTVYKVELDGRYGKPKVLAPQIVAAQRKYTTDQQSRAMQQ